jgi:hypothetical protein
VLELPPIERAPSADERGPSVVPARATDDGAPPRGDQRAPVATPRAEEPEPTPRAIEHRVTCGAVTAVWTGENDGTYDHWSALAFKLAGRTRTFTRELPDNDAGPFEIFSPDCRRVLLLQSRMGPFHVVRTRDLAAYLGGAPPERELRGERSPDGISGTGVFRGGGWVSNTEVAFAWGCCVPPITTHVTLPAIH